MTDLMTLLLLDLAVIVLLTILAYLSKRLGDALKIKPYFLILYFAALLIGAASVIDIAAGSLLFAPLPLLTLLLRCAGGILGIGVCLRYWSWLFSEFFGG